jgi:SAM-dependent methyltransferase
MNSSHSELTDWGLTHVSIERDFIILDVGCGGGRTIQKMAAIATDGSVFGVDYAKGSVAASRAKNEDLIKAGRVEIQEASVSHLPFNENTFDLATAVETQYYWPDLVNDMREILRVLKPGATLLVIAESYSGSRYDILHAPAMRLLRSKRLSIDGHNELFTTAGFAGVQVFEEHNKSWLCATGNKPVESSAVVAAAETEL